MDAAASVDPLCIGMMISRDRLLKGLRLQEAQASFETIAEQVADL